MAARQRFVRASLLICLGSCGIGDEVLLGRFSEQAPDGSDLDGGNQDGSNGGGPGDRDAANAGDGDASTTRPECVVPAEREPVTCTTLPPGDNDLPRIKWQFPPASLQLTQDAPPGTPLVANLTDDNGDGRVDLCDVPDVVLVAGSSGRGSALWMLAGDTGRVEKLFDQPILPRTAPAIADLDADGVPEILAIDETKHLVALRPDGSSAWKGAEVSMPTTIKAACYAISVYDVDGDGSPEILAGFDAYDATGSRRFGVPTSFATSSSVPEIDGCMAPIAADLTGDGQLEMLFGHYTLLPDGKEYWRHRTGDTPSVPVMANLDSDPQTEVVLMAPTMVYVLEADGTERASLVRNCGGNAPSVHDFNGDGIDELALPDCDGSTRATVYQLQDNALVPRWSADNIVGSLGTSSVAAFDFLGRNVPDLVFADNQSSAFYAGIDGRMIFEKTRLGMTVVGSPVIADVDNDGNGEVLVPAFELGNPAVLFAIGRAPGAWMNTRRIWNQHAYHVTNVHEDARIPRAAGDAPKVPTRMRSNAHRQGNRLCVP